MGHDNISTWQFSRHMDLPHGHGSCVRERRTRALSTDHCHHPILFCSAALPSNSPVIALTRALQVRVILHG